MAHPIFSIYSALGTVAVKDYITKTINEFIGHKLLTTNLPSTTRVSLMDQPESDRYILHLLYANTIKRGGEMELESAYPEKTQSVEIIEDLIPIYDVKLELTTEKKIKSIKLQPVNKTMDFNQENCEIKFKIDKLLSHQMIELNY